jgi:hypothetical protein
MRSPLRWAPDARVVALAIAVAALVAAQARSDDLPAGSGVDAVAKYRAALAALPAMGNVVFDYVETRSGPARALTEAHRVYRDAAGDERDETTAVDGVAVIPPIVKFSSSPDWAYDPHGFAADADDYQTMALGASSLYGKRVLRFSAVRTTAGDFALTMLFLDPVSALPVREEFTAAGGGCSGSGWIEFGKVDRRLMPTVVTVTCADTATGQSFKQTIRFTGYRFVRTLPPQAFEQTGQ